jgi:hypothetical protein
MQNSLRQKGNDEGRELGVTCVHGGSDVGYATVYELPSPLSTLFGFDFTRRYPPPASPGYNA